MRDSRTPGKRFPDAREARPSNRRPTVRPGLRRPPPFTPPEESHDHHLRHRRHGRDRPRARRGRLPPRRRTRTARRSRRPRPRPRPGLRRAVLRARRPMAASASCSSRRKPDYVHICTPPGSHVPLAIEVLRGGAVPDHREAPGALARRARPAARRRARDRHRAPSGSSSSASAPAPKRCARPSPRACSAARSWPSARRSGTATRTTSPCRGAASGTSRAAGRPWATASIRWICCSRCSDRGRPCGPSPPARRATTAHRGRLGGPGHLRERRGRHHPQLARLAARGLAAALRLRVRDRRARAPLRLRRRPNWRFTPAPGLGALWPRPGPRGPPAARAVTPRSSRPSRRRARRARRRPCDHRRPPDPLALGRALRVGLHRHHDLGGRHRPGASVLRQHGGDRRTLGAAPLRRGDPRGGGRDDRLHHHPRARPQHLGAPRRRGARRVRLRARHRAARVAEALPAPAAHARRAPREPLPAARSRVAQGHRVVAAARRHRELLGRPDVRARPVLRAAREQRTRRARGADRTAGGCRVRRDRASPRLDHPGRRAASSTRRGASRRRLDRRRAGC